MAEEPGKPIGWLGDVMFTVSENQMRLIESFQWSGSTNVETHTVHLGNSVTEAAGRNPDSIELTITLSKYLSVDPMEEMTRLWTYMRNYEPIPFTLGSHAYGRYRWIITSLTNDLIEYDRNGDVRHASVRVSLLEYLREWYGIRTDDGWRFCGY